MDSIAGIYRILNIVTGKVYIGSAKSFKKRWANHKSTLKKHSHRSILLQRAWNKYGEICFRFDVIEEIENPTKELLESREQYWLDFYRSYDPEKGYNINQYATSSLGRKLSQETKNKISKATIGRSSYIRTDEQKELCRKKLLGNKFGIGNKSRSGKTPWNKGLNTTRFTIICCICGNRKMQNYKGQKTCSKKCHYILAVSKRSEFYADK